MKRLGLRSILVLTLMPWALKAQVGIQRFPVGRPIPELRLTDGRVLQSVTVVTVGPSVVMAKWDGGRGSIPFALLPDDARAYYATIAPKPVATQPEPQKRSASGSRRGSELPDQIRLTNGFVMKDCTITRWKPDGIMVSYIGGNAPIRFVDIDPEQRDLFLDAKAKALSRQMQSDNSAIASSSSNDGDHSAEDASRDAAERKAEEIKKGLDYHHLVIGMTINQAREAFGGPTRSSISTNDYGGYGYWVYENRGRDIHGNPCDRQVYFDKGIVTGWTDN
jgi:hypothetical protein